MYGKMSTVRFCIFLSSSPRVVKIAAALQPNPISMENAALPESPTLEKMPSVMNASDAK